MIDYLESCPLCHAEFEVTMNSAHFGRVATHPRPSKCPISQVSLGEEDFATWNYRPPAEVPEAVRDSYAGEIALRDAARDDPEMVVTASYVHSAVASAIRETLRLCGYDISTLDNIDGERG